ncbi:MAG: hypothetical protein JWM10_766 [Myxococcaceae bacterium]|nr:hypothetical protein [Myxococcaceae bacterium]
MTTELKHQAFLEKLAEVATHGPLQVKIVRQVAPEFVQVGDRTELRDFVHIVYRFHHGGEDYLTREFAAFDDAGDADLSRLAVWPRLSHLLPDGGVPANDAALSLLRNVRPVLMHRSGSV